MKTKEYFDQFAAKLDCLAWNVDTAPWADWAWEIVEQEISTAERCRIVDLGNKAPYCAKGVSVQAGDKGVPGRRHEALGPPMYESVLQ